MNRTTWRVLRTEVLRGMAPVTVAAFAAVSAAMLMNETEDWAGRWLPFAEYVRVTLIVLVPLAVAAGAWRAGREHRRRTADQLVASARPRWQPGVMAWAAVTIGMIAGSALAWGAAAAFTASVASHHNSGWLLTLAVAVAGIAAASALGLVVGRLVRNRLVAPVAGVLTYVGLGIVTYDDRWRGVMLAPSLGNAGPGTSSLATGLQLGQLGWLAALAATLLVLATARRWWLAALPGAIAVTAAVAVAAWPLDERRVPDAAASELVCTTDGGPEVCLARVNAFLLADAVPAMREQLARWDGVEGGFGRAVDATPWYDTGRAGVPSDTVIVSVTQLISWNARLAETNEYGFGLADDFGWAPQGLVIEACDVEWPGDEPYDAAMEAAAWWARDGELGAGIVFFEDDPESDDKTYEPPVVQALLERPEAEQRAWMGRYLAAARECDETALTELARELR
jgi:hypothetical protein